MTYDHWKTTNPADEFMEAPEQPWPERVAEFLFGPKVRDCPRCEGVGRINHQCGMGACVDDPCPDCDGRGYFFKNPSPHAAGERTK
jgi:hypothetical protein